MGEEPKKPRGTITFVEEPPYTAAEIALAERFDDEDLIADERNGAVAPVEAYVGELGDFLTESLNDRHQRNLERARRTLQGELPRGGSK